MTMECSQAETGLLEWDLSSLVGEEVKVKGRYYYKQYSKDYGLLGHDAT
jgi:hypothetical protein